MNQSISPAQALCVGEGIEVKKNDFNKEVKSLAGA
jgi:translation elongation factor EF-Ts